MGPEEFKEAETERYSGVFLRSLLDEATEAVVEEGTTFS